MATHNDPAAITALYNDKVGAGLNALLAHDGLMFNHDGLVLPGRRTDGFATMNERAQLELLHELEIDLVTFGLGYLGEIGRADRVLDAGCGGGGAAIMIAERFGCAVQGATLSDAQARFATSAARARQLQDRVRFTVADMAEYGRDSGPFAAI
jgi:geranyl diphosphate 2-C-methyltransferase